MSLSTVPLWSSSKVPSPEQSKYKVKAAGAPQIHAPKSSWTVGERGSNTTAQTTRQKDKKVPDWRE